eukprot:404215-Prorocentrum_minimum.AAC.1
MSDPQLAGRAAGLCAHAGGGLARRAGGGEAARRREPPCRPGFNPPAPQRARAAAAGGPQKESCPCRARAPLTSESTRSAQDETLTLRSLGLTEGSCLFVGEGGPRLPGHCLLKLSLYNPAANKAMFTPLFELDVPGALREYAKSQALKP